MFLNALCNLKDYMKASRNTPRGLQSLGENPVMRRGAKIIVAAKFMTPYWLALGVR
jgi:hypothetical protein